MKIVNTFLIVTLCWVVQCFGAAVDQQIAKDFARTLIWKPDYIKAKSILEQHPELAKGFEYTNSGNLIKMNPLFYAILDVTSKPEEKIEMLPGIVELLLRFGASLDDIGDTDMALKLRKPILFEFVRGNDPKTEKQKQVLRAILKLLLANGANIDAQEGVRGYTALMKAAGGIYANLDIIKMLVEEGKADLNITNKNGMTALQILKDAYDYLVKGLKRIQESDNLSQEDKELALQVAQDQVNKRKAAIDYLESRMEQANAQK